MKRILTACVVTGLLMTSAGLAGDERDATAYIGVKMCKMCHKAEPKGNQFGKWEASAHAKAFATLASPEAKAAGAKAGVEDPQKSGKCLKCHSTAYNFTEEKKTEAVPAEEGVSCESCHGPGKNYKSNEVMKSLEESKKNGMVHPATQSCEKCHNNTSPTWKADRYTNAKGEKVGFDPEQAAKKIEHPNPAAQK